MHGFSRSFLTRAILLMLAWVLASAGPVLAEGEDPLPWLERMTEAFRNHTYQGTIVYAHGDRFRTMRVLHEAGGDLEREKVTEMEGGLREVLREGDMVICRLPEADSGKSEYCPHAGPFSRAFFNDVGRLRDSYRVRVAGRDRVAGREAVKVAIEPIDADRYGYRLWLDVESSMLLKCLLENTEGVVLERFQFTELQVGGDIPDIEFKLGDGYTTHHHFDVLPKTEPPPALEWDVNWMPAGFLDVRDPPKQAAAVGARLYSDGLAVVSVFVEPAAGRDTMETSDSMGATVAVSRIHAGGDGNWLVTVVGEVPEQTARRMAESVTISAR